MWIKICFLLVLILNFSDCGKIKLKKDAPKSKFSKGVEFNDISRGSLLRILSAYQEQLNKRIAGRKLKPVVTAQFANNKHTNRFIYPDVKKIGPAIYL